MIIEHTIDNTHKELYHFKAIGNIYRYIGITYSNRSDVGEIWGHKWEGNGTLQLKYEAEVGELAKSLGYADFDDFIHGGNWDQPKDGVWEIKKKYNPTCCKTTSGEPYLRGVSFGNSTKGHEPKMSIEQLELAILEKTRMIKVIL